MVDAPRHARRVHREPAQDTHTGAMPPLTDHWVTAALRALNAQAAILLFGTPDQKRRLDNELERNRTLRAGRELGLTEEATREVIDLWTVQPCWYWHDIRDALVLRSQRRDWRP